MKKGLCILLSGLLVLSLGACSASGPQSSGATSIPATEERWDDVEPPAGAETYAEDNMEQPAEPEDDAWRYAPPEGEEEYDHTGESPFKSTTTSPLSTFSSDVDTASYSNMRRFIQNGMVPEGVRIEELVNYFDYSYPRPAPQDEHPFSISTEVAACPWNPDHLLAMVGVQGAAVNNRNIDNNIVFLIDVSGSMSDDNKLPLLRESFKLLIDGLGENDVISIVTYAGSDRIVADSVRGDQHSKLNRLMNSLEAGGSTAGARGLETAYELADKNYIEGGNNRILLATDGDFNVGPSSTAALEALVERERERGVSISVLGFGMYNLKDNIMETIADKGNGHYAYIDTLAEAQKVLVDEFDATMFTIAKDLKFQVEFNPAMVAQYRLIGYNNRRMENEDFNNDAKDAGDVGAGHSVTAFYELIPAGGDSTADEEALIYQEAITSGLDDYMTVKVRYKAPGEDESRLVQQVVPAAALSRRPGDDFVFAAAVAEYGLILTDSAYKGRASLSSVASRAGAATGGDVLREEFLTLVNRCGTILD